MAVLFIVGTANYVDRNVISILLEPIKNEFHVSDAMLGLLGGIAFSAVYATLGIPVAHWADRGDRRLVVSLAVGLWSLMTVICGLTGSFWQLAAARFGVGAGEAGSVPPAQSLIADYYPPSDRAKALGIFMLSAAVGNAVGLGLGGLIAQRYGWRETFLLVGAAGLLLAPLTRWVLAEPRRQVAVVQVSLDRETLVGSISALLAKRAYRCLLAGIALQFFVSYGAIVFLASFMTRVHGLSVAGAGVTLGSTSALSAIIGTLSGGALADRLAVKNVAWLPRVAGWAMLVSMPLLELALVAGNIDTMLLLAFFALTSLNASLPAMFGAVHVVCGSARRALSIAVVLFVANLIGAGIGPIVAGSLSDALATTAGAPRGLQEALIIVVSFLVLAGCLMLRAGHHFENDRED